MIALTSRACCTNGSLWTWYSLNTLRAFCSSWASYSRRSGWTCLSWLPSRSIVSRISWKTWISILSWMSRRTLWAWVTSWSYNYLIMLIFCSNAQTIEKSFFFKSGCNINVTYLCIHNSDKIVLLSVLLCILFHNV